VCRFNQGGLRFRHPDLYLIVLAAEDAFVRDGDPVGVTRQVVQHLGRPTGRWLGIDHPVVGQQGLAACPPGRGRGLGIIGNCPVLSGLIQRIEKLAPEQARGGLDRKQEAPTASWCAPPFLFIEPTARAGRDVAPDPRVRILLCLVVGHGVFS
jgi:hypothetical protein